MQRNAIISAFTPTMRFSVRGANDAEPEVEGRRCLELRGTLVESSATSKTSYSSYGPIDRMGATFEAERCDLIVRSPGQSAGQRSSFHCFSGMI
jgi:hypothetical protein